MKLERQYRWLGLLTWFLMARLRLQSFWKVKDIWKYKFESVIKKKQEIVQSLMGSTADTKGTPGIYNWPLGLHVIVAVVQPHRLIFSFKNTCLALIFSEIGLLFGVF